MGDSLSVCGDAIMELGSEWYNGRIEAGQNFLHLVVASAPVSVCNDDLSTISSARGPRSSAITSGCPLGSTAGACREWQETMSISLGRCLSRADISGALHDV